MLAQLACEVRVARAVPRTVFHPVPNVDSVLVEMVRTAPAAAPALRALVGAAFGHRRKTVARSIALAGEAGDRERVLRALELVGLPRDVRAERLSPDDFRKLVDALAAGT